MEDIYTLNDYELLYLIRTGDSTAHRMLLAKYENYMQVLMDRFVEGTEVEMREDLMQECRILLADLCMRYREDQNCSFLTFLVNGIRNRIKSITRKEQRRLKNIRTVSLDSFVKEEGISITYGDYLDCRSAFYQPDFEWRYADSIEQLMKLLNSLSDKEKKVWELMNEGIGYEDAADIMGISRKQFDNMRLRLKKKIVFSIMKSDIPNHH